MYKRVCNASGLLTPGFLCLACICGLQEKSSGNVGIWQMYYDSHVMHGGELKEVARVAFFGRDSICIV